jgi:2-polyprenyl-3-methyl-5-hydroxy-6-metoxy-1,4-benzoquinol methylase
MALIEALALALLLQTPAADAPKIPPTEQMMQEAAAIRGQTSSAFAQSLLAGFGCLQPIEPITIYYNKETRTAVSAAEASKLTEEQLKAYTKKDVDTDYYYFTRYGTPVAFVRPMELLGRAGMSKVDGLKLVDFGFGSIGQLHALAAMGADVTGIEVDPIMPIMYAKEPGKVTRCSVAGKGRDGSINLAYGQFPKDPSVVKKVGTGYDVFISKNTLKHGYIHPEQEVDPRMLVHLDVTDEAFVRAVYDALKPGGFFMIYNLSPAPAKPGEKYIPWADGRSPFTTETFTKVGFKVLAFDVEDSEAARAMGKTFGWGTDAELATNFFGHYTLAQKP